MTQAGCVALMGEKRNVARQIEKYRHRWEDNIKMDVKQYRRTWIELILFRRGA
jgi:hypothetical protein